MDPRQSVDAQPAPPVPPAAHPAALPAAEPPAAPAADPPAAPAADPAVLAAPAPRALCCYNLQNACNRGDSCPFAHAQLRVGGPMCQFGEQCRLRHHLKLKMTLAQQREAFAAIAQAIVNAAAPDSCPPSLACVTAGDASEDPQRLQQLLNLADEQARDRTRARLDQHLQRLSRQIEASFPLEVLRATIDHRAARVVDGIYALALYSSDLPRDNHELYRSVNTALRIAADGNNREQMFSREDAAFVCRGAAPFALAVEWMLSDVLPKCRRVTFRGISYELHRPRVGARYEQLCFTSTSGEHRAADRFAERTMIVLMTQSGASISFASMVQHESEVLLPPGVYLEVVARASAILLSVLHRRVQLLTMREVGMRPTPNELFRAARSSLSVYEDFRAVYQLPSVAPRGAVGGAGGGAAAGNNDNNPNAVRLDAALDQTINNENNSGGDMLVIADGGTGKTAAAVFAQVHLMGQDAGRRLLPVFLPLSRLKQVDVTRQGGLDAALATALGCDVETLLQTAREFNVVAILDSLDETMVKDEHWVGLLERNPAAQQCRVIMTSRPTPLATEWHQRIFGGARRLQVLDLLPLPPLSVNEIYQQLLGCSLVGWHEDLVLPAPIAAFATPLLADFAARLTLLQAKPLEAARLEEARRQGVACELHMSDITILDGISDQRELLELYLQHTCDLPQLALSRLCLHIAARGFHCTLGEAKRAASDYRVASHVPCRVEDEFDDGADFSLLHRSLVEHVVRQANVAPPAQLERQHHWIEREQGNLAAALPGAQHGRGAGRDVHPGLDAAARPEAAAQPHARFTELCCYHLQNACNSGAGCPYAHAPLRVGGPMCQFGEQCRHRHHLGVHLTPEQQREASEALAHALRDAATADVAPPSLECVMGEASEDPPRLHQLLGLHRDGEPERVRGLIAVLLQHLSREGEAAFPVAVLQVALEHGAARVVDGICALALYSSDFPRDNHELYLSVNTALRIAADGNSRETMFSREDAAFVCLGLEPFTRAATWMVREVLPKCPDVMFRGISYELHRPRVGARYEQLCFNSMSDQHGEADRFARRAARGTMMVLMTQSGASISFASLVRRESEVLLPPGVYLEVVARASATLLSVLHMRVQLLTMREVGMRPTPDELFKAVRAVLPVYRTFVEMYQMPSLISHEAKEVMRLFGGEAGGGAAAGNDNPNAVRLDAVLDQTINNENNSGGDMLIIADGGTGKTAAAVFAQVHLSHQDASRRLLPIFLPLSRLKQVDVTGQGGLDAALASALGCDVETLLQTAREFNVVAVLDSLDETTVKDEHWVGLLERNPAAQQCRVIMTSRPMPLATEWHQRIFGSARRLQVLDLLPLPPLSVNEIYQQLLGCSLLDRYDELVLPAPIAAFATPLLAGFAARLTLLQAKPLEEARLEEARQRGVACELRMSDITILDGITSQRDLLERYLQHTCDLPQEALSRLCLRVLTGGFHCTLGEAKLAAEADDVASRVPCRVEDEFDDGADFSLLHRSLVEHVVAREVAAGRLSFCGQGGVGNLSPVLLTGITRMLLADPQCAFGVRLTVVQHLIVVDGDASALEPAQELLAEEEWRADGRPTEEVVGLLAAIASACQIRGDLQRAWEFGEHALRMQEALYEQEQDAEEKQWRGRRLAVSCNNVATIYYQQENYAAAQQHYERAIELGERHGDDEVEIARRRENLAGVFLEQGDPARALQEYARCLAIYERRLGCGHHYVAQCLSNMGNARGRLGQPAQALPLLQRALEIRLRELPADHVGIAHSHSKLGITQRSLGNKPEAQRHFQEAVRIYELNGRTRDVEVCRVKLAQLDA